MRNGATFDSQQEQAWKQFISDLSPRTTPETFRLMGLLRHVSHSLYQASEHSLHEAGLSYAQYRLLMGLLFCESAENRPSLNPSEISRMQGTSRNTISALIRSLEEDGLIERALDPHDRRKFNIQLTEAGRHHVRSHAHRHIDMVNDAFSTFDQQEIDQLTFLLDKLSRATHAGDNHASDS